MYLHYSTLCIEAFKRCNYDMTQIVICTIGDGTVYRIVFFFALSTIALRYYAEVQWIVYHGVCVVVLYLYCGLCNVVRLL